MQRMPTLISSNPAAERGGLIPNTLVEIGVAEDGKLQRCLDRFLGELTADEKDFVECACDCGWTIRVIIDHLMGHRGMAQVQLDVDWRTI